MDYSVISCGEVDNLRLRLGERANLELASGERMWSEIVGVKLGYFLSVWVPDLKEADYKKYFTDYPEVTVRAKCDGCYLCGFKSSVTRVQLYPYPLLFLSYPRKFEKINLRKSKRVECFQLVSLCNEACELTGVFRDISEGGGRIECTFPRESDVGSFVENERIRYRFDYAQSYNTISGVGVIRNLIQAGSRLSLGLKFESFDGDCKSDLAKVIKSFDI
ncbi:flagellar brake domain-containing protein [Maridesulfovibrio sp. FT414]|uniref:PilZ domain-containing protein n=1 Tax=Maridesulfovibrio sp. FT414 TaxID=2979469 RepID=UPI003D802E83